MAGDGQGHFSVGPQRGSSSRFLFLRYSTKIIIISNAPLRTEIITVILLYPSFLPEAVGYNFKQARRAHKLNEKNQHPKGTHSSDFLNEKT